MASCIPHAGLLFTTVLIMLTVAPVQGSLTDVLDRCCDIGRQWFTANRESCSTYTSPIQGVLHQDRAACRALIDLCCLVQRQEKQCIMGKQSARIRKSCDGLNSRPGSEEARECCNCCHLGIIAQEADLPCTMLTRYGSRCDEAFQDCCNGSQSILAATTTTASALQTEASDLDICSRFPGQLCAHVCISTPGSYDCACHDGFVLLSDRKTCRQSTSGNRCDTNNPCQHRCEDSGHGVHCRCFDGFVLEVDGRNCKDVDECSTNNHTCTAHQRCVNTDGSYRCDGPTAGHPGTSECHRGFTWNRLLRRCEDVNECVTRRNPCNSGQVCVNTEGSYRCDDDDDELVSDENAENPDEVPTNASATEAGSCGTGFSYNSETKLCEDINECQLGQQSSRRVCPELNQMCRNAVGSYSCVRMCETGYQYIASRHVCEDINECAMNQDTCTEGQTCENTMGSFNCRRSMSCGTGYTLDQQSQQCLDDDECRLGTHNCGATRECNNIPGSFRCIPKECPYGYKLDLRTGICEPVVCARGMKPDNGGNCIDLNECAERPELCRSNQECRNTIGSYTCHNMLTCGGGYELNDAGTRCDDIDECQSSSHECTGAMMMCVNRPGSYMCQCPEGFQMNHGLRACEDLDECQLNPQACASNARCENTHGSFRCICNDGFESDQDNCRDIDECSRPGMCQHECRNTWGSFQCTCEEGYQIATDGRMCDDVDECQLAAESNRPLCNGICENTHGSYACSCPNGYQMSNDGFTCQDMDECFLRTSNCNTPEEVCINTRGGFKCQAVTCPNGFVKAQTTNNRNSNVKCQRKTFLCPQGDVECLYAPLSYSTNFITFPTKIRVPADLFTMRGPLSPYRRLVFDLKLVKAEDPISGHSRVNRTFFNIHQMRDNEAVIQLLHQVEGPQDVELQLDMNIYSKEFRQNDEEVFFGTAVARIFVYVTKDDW